MSTQKVLVKNSIAVSAALGLSAILGFLRESIIAYKFGATAETDAFLIAMIIPNLFIGLVKGSITNTFITVYSGYMFHDQVEEGWRMTNIVLTLLTLIMLGVSVLFASGTTAVVHLVAPSYQGDQLSLAVSMTRILLPSIIFGTLMGVLVGINNANHSFLAPSMIGLVSNVVTILSIFILGAFWGIKGLAVGSMLGILAQFLIQLPSAYKHGLRFKFVIDFNNLGLKESIRLVAPFILTAAASQINLIVDRTLATGLPRGIVSALYFANKLVFLPLIFTGAIGMVVFPIMIGAAARRDWEELVEGFQRSVRLLSLVLLPTAIGIFVLRLPLVKLLFEHGAFTAQDTQITAGTVGYYLGALYFGSMSMLVANIYFALKKMVVAAGTGIVAVFVNIGFSLWLIHPLEQKGLALANSISALVNLILLIAGLFIVLRQYNITDKILRGLGTFLVRVALVVTSMALVVHIYLHAVQGYFFSKAGLVFLVLSSVLVGVIAYTIVAYVLHIEEVHKGVSLIARKGRKFLDEC